MTGVALGAALLGGAALGLAPTLALGALLAWAVGTGARPALGLTAAIVVAAAVGAWRGTGPPDPVPMPWADTAVGVAGHVASIPTTDGRFQRFVVAVDVAWDGTQSRPAIGRLDATVPARPRVEVGDAVWLLGSVTPLDDATPGYAAYLRSLGCGGSVFARTLEIDATGDDRRRPLAGLRRRIDAVFARAAPGDTAALLAGLVTGDDHALSRDRRAAFVRTGTTHLTAVSGSNVALLVTVAAFGASGQRRRRLSWQVAVVLSIWAYAALVGLPPPATRAALVATGAIFAVRAGRRPDVLTLLALSAGLMVLVRPDVLWSLSFGLSFAASLGLVAVAGDAAPFGVGGWLRAAAAVTVAAQFATLPLQVAAFGEISLVAVPANVLLAPLVLLAFPLAFLAAALGVVAPPLGEAVAAVAALPVEAMLLVVDGLGGNPAASFPLQRPGPVATALLALACATLLCCWSRDGRRWLRRTVADARAAGRQLAATLAAVVGFAAVIIVAVLATG